jgi:hypothetical protein
MLACSLSVAAYAQTGETGFFNPLSASRGGLHLYNVSLNAGYFPAATRSVRLVWARRAGWARQAPRQ